MFSGTIGKDKSGLSWLLTEEINHSAHRRIAFQSASWELHYPAPATHYHADRRWLGRQQWHAQPTSVTAGENSDHSPCVEMQWPHERWIIRVLIYVTQSVVSMILFFFFFLNDDSANSNHISAFKLLHEINILPSTFCILFTFLSLVIYQNPYCAHFGLLFKNIFLL